MSRCAICGLNDPNPYHGHATIREAVTNVRRHVPTPVAVPADPTPEENMTTHHADVHHTYQAECDCGWSGPERDRRTDALEDADQHESQPPAPADPDDDGYIIPW